MANDDQAVPDLGPVDPAALIGTSLAGVLAVLVSEGPFNEFEIPIGITLLAILLLFDHPRRRHLTHAFVYASGGAFAGYITAGFWLERFYRTRGYPGDSNGHIPADQAAWIWSLIFSLVLALDAFRLSALSMRDGVFLTLPWKTARSPAVIDMHESVGEERPSGTHDISVPKHKTPKRFVTSIALTLAVFLVYFFGRRKT